MDHDTVHDSAPTRTGSSTPDSVETTRSVPGGSPLSFADDAESSHTDIDALRRHDDVPVRTETAVHDGFDHCAMDIEGRVVVAVENEDGDRLVLCTDDIGVAVLPHGDVMPGEDWARVACEAVESRTGLSIALHGVELLRDINHVLSANGKPHRTTYRLVLSAHPVGGERQHHEAGRDAWAARWVGEIPDELGTPDGGPGDDITHVFG
jgi:hypothetical protein